MIINKYIVHLLDKEGDSPVLNDFEGKSTKEMDAFLQKAIKKVLKNDENVKLKFNNYNSNIVKNISDHIIYNSKNFIEDSKELASYLFDYIKESEMKSSDFIIALITIKDQQMVVILNLEFSSHYTHLIDFIDEKFSIKVIENNNILSNRKISNAAIVDISGINDEYHLRAYGCDTFIKDYLDATIVYDDSYKTKMFDVVTDHILTNYTTDVKECLDATLYRNYKLKESFVIDVDKFIDDMDLNVVVSTAIKQELDRHNVTGEFEVDKKYIERKLKKKVIKTDTMIEIKADLADIEDPMKFRLSQNQDGSYDILIRNVRDIR